MHTSAYPARQSGLSLVELMVGMMVGLIGIVIISHLYLTNEQYKRSTTGAGAAQVNGAIALYSIERDLRMAGYGINNTAALGCTCAGAGCSPVQYFFNNKYSNPPDAGSTLRTLQIAPVVIVKTLPPFPPKPDSITLLYGGDNERSTPTKLLQTMSPPAYDFIADGAAGFENNNMVVVTQGGTCALAQITVGGDNSQLLHPAGTYNPANNANLPIFSRDASVFNLGVTPVWRTYTIENNKLVATEVLPPEGGAGGQPLVDDIIDMKALYGKDTDNDPQRTVDAYDGATPTTAAGWQQVLAVRVAVLARSQNYEKPDPVAGCNATTVANQPTWGKGAVVPPGDPLPPFAFPVLAAALITPGNEAGCYKYRVFETVVPLRNMIWR